MTDLSDLKHKIKQINQIKPIQPLKSINTYLILTNMYCTQTNKPFKHEVSNIRLKVVQF